MNQERESTLKGLFTESPNICPECKQGVLVEKMSGDRENDEIYYYGQCSWCGHTAS